MPHPRIGIPALLYLVILMLGAGSAAGEGLPRIHNGAVPRDKAKLQGLLLYHVAAGQALPKDLSYFQRVETLEGSKVSLEEYQNPVKKV